VRLSLLEWAMAGVLGFLVLVLGLQSWRLHSVNAKLAAQTQALSTWQDANRTNVRTIGTLKTANDRWAAACRLDPKLQAEAVRLLNVRIVSLEDALRQAQHSREVIYVRDPKARAWGDAAVPAAIADQLFPQRPPR
jgi:hypothetical protein